MIRPCLVLVLALAAVLLGFPDRIAGPGGLGPAAWATDDGDDDGGGDDGGGGQSGGRDSSDRAPPERRHGAGGASISGRSTCSAAGAGRRARAAPLPSHAPEIVASDLEEADLATLTGAGFTLIETVALPGLDTVLTRLSAPPGQSLDEARAFVRLLPGAPGADFNHYYRTNEAPTAVAFDAPACRHGNCAAHALVSWSDSCTAAGPIGIIDTGVNTDHELLSGAGIELVSFTQGDPSEKVHGTAVVSVLAGTRGGRVEGLLPETPLVVVDIFSRAGTDERADLVALLRGLDALVDRRVRLVNLSLSGPANDILARVVAELVDERGMVLIAAAGNGGPKAAPAYPGAYDGVIAVTAVDGRGRIYRAAQRGPHIDFAAPGVDLALATSISGARTRSGTSFATPFVTAAAAVALSREPDLSPAALTRLLADAARDLGAEGRDEIFGYGLLDAGALCAP